ncbi:MAG: hypothetical protein ACW99U_05070 [Candidatus Thorarchaeota archaeon]|jgi:hypothetical protein
MLLELLPTVFVISIILCWLAQEGVKRRSITIPKAYAAIGHILYGVTLVVFFFLM